jgi:hypothetical protein
VAKDVTLWPLVADEGAVFARAELWPLDEALEDGFVGVAAARGGGLVEIESRAPVPVWVPAGEPLGGVGLAADSRVVAPHGRTVVRVRAGGAPCARCARALARAFHAGDAPLGFVAAVHDRAVALELVAAPGLLARRLGRRLEAWAPWLLAAEEEGGAVGLDSPEALIAAARVGRPLAGRARAEIVCAGPATALTL